MFKLVSFFILFLVITFSLITKDKRVVESKGYIIMPPAVGDDASPIPLSTIREDCRDLLVADKFFGNFRFMWRENVTTDGIMHLWFKANLNAGTEDIWYLYYNNPNYSADNNNQREAFLFYDNFNGNLADNWENRVSGQDYDAYPRVVNLGGNNVLRLIDRAGYRTPNGDRRVLRTHRSFDARNSLLEFRVYDEGDVFSVDVGFDEWEGKRCYGMFFGSPHANQELRVVTNNQVGNFGVGYKVFGNRTWYKFILLCEFPTVRLSYSQLNNYYVTISDPRISWLLGRITIRIDNGLYETRVCYIDDILMRRYVNPEPTVTLGEEESGNWGGFKKRRKIIIRNHTSHMLPDYSFRLPIRVASYKTFIGDM